MRRAVALVLIALMATGCSRAVEIPLDQLGEAEWRKPGTYRLSLVRGDEYYARRLSVADSNVIVEERMEIDEALFGYSNQPPDSIPITALRGVEKIESRKKTIALYLGIVGAMFGALLMMGSETDT